MNDIRARFEEIWPVPRGCMWTDDNGYLPIDPDADHLVDRCIDHDARLDTFTRCQETTAIHLSLIEEMLQEIESCHADLRSENWYVPRKSALLDRAKQIMGTTK